MQLYWVFPLLRTLLFLGHIIDISIFRILHFIFLLVMHLPSCSANFERKEPFLELQRRHKMLAFRLLDPVVSLLLNHQHMFQVCAWGGGEGGAPLVLNWLFLHSFPLCFTHFLYLEANSSGSLWYQVMKQESIEIRKFEEVVYEVYFILKTFSLMLHCRVLGSMEVQRSAWEI